MCAFRAHNFRDLQYTLGEKHEVMGSALHIPLPAGLQAGSSVKVTIEYSTTEPGCKALQWLDKASVSTEQLTLTTKTVGMF